MRVLPLLTGYTVVSLVDACPFLCSLLALREECQVLLPLDYLSFGLTVTEFGIGDLPVQYSTETVLFLRRCDPAWP